MRVAFGIGAVTALGAALIAQQPPPRDARPAREVAAPGSIAGVVLSDEAQPRPLRRATVTLTGASPEATQTTITNDDGTFAFRGLTAGRYSVRAVKEAYVPMAFGASRPNRPGTRLNLRDGEKANIVIALPRGAVITGVITGADGQPMPGIITQALRSQFDPVTGERQLRPEGLGVAGSNISDDRGVYRIFGLPAGEYVIGTIVRPSNPGLLPTQSSAADVRRAVAELRDPGPAPADASQADARPVTMAPAYYPGGTSAAQAGRIAVAAGQERSGIDFQVHHTAAATIRGTVANMPAGAHTAVSLITKGENLPGVMRTIHTDEGRFVFSNIEPGSYLLLAIGLMETRPGEPSATQYATAEVVVDGQDLDGVVLAAQSSLTLAGRLDFEGTPPPAATIPRTVRIPVRAFSGPFPVPDRPMQIEDGWRFRIDGLVPGPIATGAVLSGGRTPLGSWWIKSVVVNGRDLLDAPLELRQSIDDVVVTLTQKPTELSGTVVDDAGASIAQTFVVAFSIDRQFWFINSRRIAGVRTDANGRYVIRNLPPGDYLLFAFDDLEQNEWFDPAVLERSAGDATKVRIGEAETKRQDLVMKSALQIR